MQQTFFIGSNPDERCQKVDISSFKTIEQLKTKLGQTFGFADPTCKLLMRHTNNTGNITN